MELPQTTLIERVKRKCTNDDRVAAALTYGSFTKGEGDQYSDIEFWMFIPDEALDDFDQEQWIDNISPVHWTIVNEAGARVAFFKDHLVRGEFHFAPLSAMSQVASWPAGTGVVVADRTDKLQGYIEAGESPVPSTAQEVSQLCGRFLNWYLFGVNVLKRGDLAQAHVILGMLQGYLIWMARLDENSTMHWQTQSKSLEKEVSASAYERLTTATAGLGEAELQGAYDSAWIWSTELISRLEHTHKFSIPSEFKQAIQKHQSP